MVFLEHAKLHSTKAGKATSEICILKSCMRPLNDLYGRTPAAEFGPPALKAVREKMITVGAAPVVRSGDMHVRRILAESVSPACAGPLPRLGPVDIARGVVPLNYESLVALERTAS